MAWNSVQCLVNLLILLLNLSQFQQMRPQRDDLWVDMDSFMSIQQIPFSSSTSVNDVTVVTPNTGAGVLQIFIHFLSICIHLCFSFYNEVMKSRSSFHIGVVWCQKKYKNKCMCPIRSSLHGQLHIHCYPRRTTGTYQGRQAAGGGEERQRLVEGCKPAGWFHRLVP